MFSLCAYVHVHTHVRAYVKNIKNRVTARMLILRVRKKKSLFPYTILKTFSYHLSETLLTFFNSFPSCANKLTIPSNFLLH